MGAIALQGDLRSPLCTVSMYYPLPYDHLHTPLKFTFPQSIASCRYDGGGGGEDLAVMASIENMQVRGRVEWGIAVNVLTYGRLARKDLWVDGAPRSEACTMVFDVFCLAGNAYPEYCLLWRSDY